MKFLNTAFGSYLKVFVTVLLTTFLAMNKGIFDLDTESIKMLVSAAFMSLIPIVLNALNPNDPRYGRNKLTDKPPKNDTE